MYKRVTCFKKQKRSATSNECLGRKSTTRLLEKSFAMRWLYASIDSKLNILKILQEIVPKQGARGGCVEAQPMQSDSWCFESYRSKRKFSMGFDSWDRFIVARV